MDFIKKYWWVFLIAIAIIVAAYLMSKPPAVTEGSVKIDSDGDGKGDTAFNPRPYTDAIHADVYSKLAPLWFRDTKPYEDLLALTSPQIIAVASDWQQRFYKTDAETMLQAINGEALPSSVTNPITARFRALNIS